MEIDLRKTGTMTVSQAKEISSLEPSVRSEYNRFIGELIKKNNLSDIDLLLQATCRNTNLSFILDRFCRFRLLRNMLEREEVIKKVFVDSVSMKSVCERLIGEFDSKVIVEYKKINLPNKYNVLNNCIKSLCLMLCLFFVPKIIPGKRMPSKPITYLENFLFIDSIDDSGVLVDRYYPSLIESIEDEGVQKSIWYVPILIGFRTIGQYFSIFKKIRRSKSNFLMKEDWLLLSDYVTAFKLSLGLHRRVITIPMWEGICVHEVVNDELIKEIGSPALVNAVLFYKFIKRLKEQKVEIDIAIDWNENQVIDRAINLAFKKYFPDVYVKGYQGYVVPDFYTCKDPTVYEVEAGSVPNEICVVGEAFVENKKRYCSNLKVGIAPAFRFSNSYNPNYLGCKKTSDIIIVLPISLQDSREILRLCVKLANIIGDQHNFIVKYHPTFTKERFFSLAPEAKNSCFRFSDQHLYDHLSSACLLISALSSVCLEAAVLGLMVAIVGTRSGPVMNPLSGLKGIESWKVCYDENEILSLLNTSHPKAAFKSNYFFQPVSTANALEFISKP